MQPLFKPLKALIVLITPLLAWSVAISSGCATAGDGGKTTGASGQGEGGATASTSSGDLNIGGGNAGSGGGEECGRQDFNVDRKPTDILLVLDRSASMEDDPSGGSGTPSKWDIVVPSLQQVITATDASISWGLKVFPEGDKKGACTAASFPNNILVGVAMKNATTVNQAISATNDKGDGTPTGDAINKAVEYLKTLNDGASKYLLLATDGDPSCPSGDAAETFATQAVTDAATAGFHTFVVGVASNANKIDTLNALAVAGLEPRVDPDPAAPKFYLASTQAQLVTSLQAITGAAASCLFPLGSVPPNPDHVGVFIDGQLIMFDPTDMNGWDYTGPDMQTIKLFGAACDQLKNSTMSQVKVIFGCKDDPIY